MKKRLGKQCGIISKIRHYVPRKLLIRHYKSNINAIVQYGVLVYSCSNASSLKKIYLLQKKILNLFIFVGALIILKIYLSSIRF